MQTVSEYKNKRLVTNLVWSRRDVQRTQHGAYSNRGTLRRMIKTIHEIYWQEYKQEIKNI
jgi:phosphoribosyl-AMP cyclohydrolase